MTRTLSRRPSPARETKLLADPGFVVGPSYEFDGYASLFGVPDLGRDTVMRGAFAESLARRGTAGIRMLWQHDPAQPIGRWLSIAEDHRGLRVRGRLNPAVARAREIAALLRDCGLDGLSIGFRVVEARRERAPPGRRLLRLDLWEISIVTFPMLPGARVDPGARVEARPRADPAGLGKAIRGATRRLGAALR